MAALQNLPLLLLCHFGGHFSRTTIAFGHVLDLETVTNMTASLDDKWPPIRCAVNRREGHNLDITSYRCVDHLENL